MALRTTFSQWLLMSLERALLPLCMSVAALATQSPTLAVFVALVLYLPLSACACLCCLYVPAVILALLAAYVRSMQWEAFWKEEARKQCGNSNPKSLNKALQTDKISSTGKAGVRATDDFANKQHIKAYVKAYWKMLREEEKKATAKVLALSAKDKKLNGEADEMGLASSSDLQEEIKRTRTQLDEAIEQRTALGDMVENAYQAQQLANKQAACH